MPITKVKVMEPPAPTLGAAAALAIDRSATGVTLMVAVLVLLAVLGSVVPGGGAMVATLAIEPDAVALVLTMKVMVTCPLGGMVTEPLTLVPAMFKVVVLAPPLTVLPSGVAPLRPAGSVS